MKWLFTNRHLCTCEKVHLPDHNEYGDDIGSLYGSVHWQILMQYGWVTSANELDYEHWLPGVNSARHHLLPCPVLAVSQPESKWHYAQKSEMIWIYIFVLYIKPLNCGWIWYIGWFCTKSSLFACGPEDSNGMSATSWNHDMEWNGYWLVSVDARGNNVWSDGMHITRSLWCEYNLRETFCSTQNVQRWHTPGTWVEPF